MSFNKRTLVLFWKVTFGPDFISVKSFGIQIAKTGNSQV